MNAYTWEDFKKILQRGAQINLALKTLRQAKGLTIKEVSEGVGITEEQLISIEQGASNYRFIEDEMLLKKIFETIAETSV